MKSISPQNRWEFPRGARGAKGFKREEIPPDFPPSKEALNTLIIHPLRVHVCVLVLILFSDLEQTDGGEGSGGGVREGGKSRSVGQAGGEARRKPPLKKNAK